MVKKWKTVTFASELTVGSKVKLYGIKGEIVSTPEYYTRARMGAWYAKIRWGNDQDADNVCLNRDGLMVEVDA